MYLNTRLRPWIGPLVLCLLVALLMKPVVSMEIYGFTDYTVHLQIAEKVKASGIGNLSHFLFHALVIACQSVLDSTWQHAGILIALFFYVLAALVLHQIFVHAFGPADTIKRAFAYPLLSLICLLVVPIPLVAWSAWTDQHLYLGYLGINVYHNPTMVVLKPLALLVCFFTIRLLQGEKFRNPFRTTLLIGGCIVLSMLAKPNYAICYIPALMLMIGWRIWKRQPIPWVILMLGIIGPCLAVLTAQYVITYGSAESSHVVWAPLVVYKHYSTHLMLKLVCSILFPLTVLLAYWKTVSRSAGAVFCWLAFGFGAFYTYFLAEAGQRLYDGNFAWSAQIALFLLFIQSLLLFVQQERVLDMKAGEWKGTSKRFLVVLTVLALHVISGVYFYLHPNQW